jgi:hypothetical protein
MKKIIRSFSIFILILCSSCNLFSLIWTNPASSKPGTVLYKDDFSKPSSGWETFSDENSSLIAYQANGLRIVVNQSQTDLWTRPGKKFADSWQEVDAIKLGGPDNNHFGLICRYQDQNNFYAFLVSSDGYSGVVKMKDGKMTILGSGSLEYNQSIHQGQALNRLRAGCIGPILILLVNGEKILARQDSDFGAGEIGLIAGSYEKPGVDIYFDNFVVYKP